MILYIENPKNCHQKTAVTDKFNNVTGYINISKLVECLYINNEAVESEIKKTIPFTIAPKRIKN